MIKTVSLGTAKLLKDAGFRKKTYFCWNNPITGVGKPEWSLERHCFDDSLDYSLYAPTTDELLDIFPYGVHIRQTAKEYVVVYRKKCFRNKILCEALAELWRRELY